jgi:hypothetical protein
METHGNNMIRKAPKNKWEKDVENYLNIMKMYNWKDCIQD